MKKLAFPIIIILWGAGAFAQDLPSADRQDTSDTAIGLALPDSAASQDSSSAASVRESPGSDSGLDVPDTTAVRQPPNAAAVRSLPDSAAGKGPPYIAVYVTGDVHENEKKALGTHILAALVNSGRYKGIERSSSFLAEIDREIVRQMSGAVDDNQISNVGKQFGVKFICIADITPAYGEFQVSARIVNVETAEVALIGQAASPLKTISDLMKVSEKVVKRMFGEPEPTEPADSPEPKFRMSAGGGGFMAGGFGGGIQWANGERMEMPYAGGGMYLYLDAKYAEAFIGYSAAGGTWKSADVSDQNSLPQMQRACLSVGVLVKYPIGVGRVQLFPLFGIDYEASISGSLKSPDGSVYDFDGAGGHPNADALSASWVMFGGGVDYGLGRTVYLRAELLYGLRTPNSFEIERANVEKAKYNNEEVETVAGNGIIFKAGIGVKF